MRDTGGRAGPTPSEAPCHLAVRRERIIQDLDLAERLAVPSWAAPMEQDEVW